MSKELAYKPIPQGVRLGDTVAQLPNTASVFDRAIWIQNCIVDNPQMTTQLYTWVDRGDDISRFILTTPKTGIKALDFFMDDNVHSVSLRSPVSGLVLHRDQRFSDEPGGEYSFSILLPNNEPEPEAGEFMFSSLCDFAWKNRNTLFYQPSEFKRADRWNDTKLKEAFDEQKTRICTIAEALPTYSDQVRDAANKLPELRPALQHLI